MANQLNQKTPPQADELEVSVFGPGFGECIVAHMGGGRWIIVDSCVDRNKKRPISLAYFDEIGVSPLGVDLILITHWHDDHVGGIEEVVDACSNAEFWCSDSLRTPEFLELLETDLKRKGLKFSRGTKCVKDVVRKIGAKFNFALSGMRIHQQAIRIGTSSVAVEAWALSPSQAENFLAKQRIGELLDDSIGSETTLPDRNPNHGSVALALQIGGNDILLGADLEETGNPDFGWSAVVSSTTRPQAFKAGLFKIPHHGSITGFHAGAWASLTNGTPIAAVSPYNLAGRVLPQSSDVSRIAADSKAAFITKGSLYQRAVRRSSSIDKLVPSSLRRVHKTPGQIRFRKSIDPSTNDWVIALFDGATEIDKFRP